MKAPVSGGGARQTAPAGTHVAVCYQIIDLGTRFDEKWQKKSRKVQFMFELPFERAVFSEEKGEQPFYVKSVQTLSMNEKANLRKFIQGWLGKSLTDEEAANFDILSLISKPCMINIIHTVKDGNTYANVQGISPLMKGMSCPAPENEVLTFDTEAPNMEVFNKLPSFIQDIIKDSDEYKAMGAAPTPPAPQASEQQQMAAARQSIENGPAHTFDAPPAPPEDLFADSKANPFA